MDVWFFFFFFKQKTAYEMRISDWSSDVCSSDLGLAAIDRVEQQAFELRRALHGVLHRRRRQAIGRAGIARLQDHLVGGEGTRQRQLRPDLAGKAPHLGATSCGCASTSMPTIRTAGSRAAEPAEIGRAHV